MDYVALLFALKKVLAALQPVLPILAPYIIALLKKALPDVMEQVPAFWKPILSAVAGIVIAYLGTQVTGETVTPNLILNYGLAAGLGLGGSKARDLRKGRPYASSEPKKGVVIRG